MGDGVKTLKPILAGVILDKFSGLEKKSNTSSMGALTWCETFNS